MMIKKHKTQTVDWYIKWIATVFVLTGISLRTTQEYMFTDITLSLLGSLGWLIVAIMWKDKALTLLNAVASTILLYGFIIGINNV
tara:strand:+ start:309 stop:563 length:255 start_codon:yes stop_codon:yes gene_type:complete